MNQALRASRRRFMRFLNKKMQRLLSKTFFVPLSAGLLCLFLAQSAISEEPLLTQARKEFQQGNYENALRLYLSVTGPDRAAAAFGASRTWTMIGEFGKAEVVCRDALKVFPEDGRIRSQLAEILARTGRSDEAIQLLEPFVSHRTATVRILVRLGELLRLRGRNAEAQTYFEQAITRFDQGLVFDAEDVALVAEASRALERYHDANTLFREAIRIEPDNLETHVLWGNLFLEKYNVAEARRSYEYVLERNDKHVSALVGMAQSVQGSSAHQFLDAALAVNHRSVSALVTRAGLLISDDRYESAEEVLRQALEINPESADALTLQAAIAYLRDDHKTFQRLERKVEAHSRVDGRFYARIAEICGRSYRFDGAVRLAQKAVAVDPGHWNGHIVLGMNLLRLGREAEGREHLVNGFQGDPFNLWAMNMLEVLDVLDGFETHRTDHFIVRMHPTDAGVLWPYLEPLLSEAWDSLTAKYGFTPRKPVLIEIFSDHEDFAVRTSGLPEIGHLLGVCFGNVITLDSPRAYTPPGSINWQEVVWHEFAHVITLQMTDNKIPRWLSEGVSGYEETNGRPEWGRRQDLELVTAVQEGRIIGLRELDAGFSQAKTPADLSFAYYEAFLLVEFIAERYGFEALKALIRQFAASRDMEVNFRKVFHLSLPEFEAGFLSWINRRVKRIDVHVPVNEQPEVNPFAAELESGSLTAPMLQRNVSVDSLRKRIEAHPRDFTAHFQLGLILYRSEDFQSATKHLITARDLLPGYSDSPSPRQVLASIYEQLGNTAALRREQEALAKVQQHAFETCFKLGQAAKAQKEYERAVYYLERAIAVNPYDPAVHRSLGDIAMQRSDYPRAIREYSVLLALDNTDPALANTDLAEAYLRGGNKSRAKKYALAALEIAPMYDRAQDILLGALEP